MYHSSDKPRKTHRNTASFSSTLLDEIYNSIDRKEQKLGDRKVFDEKPQRKQSSFSSTSTSSSAAEPKVASRRRISLMSEFQDRDLFFFDSRKTKPKAISSCFVADDHRKVLVNNGKTAAGQGQDHELLTIKTKQTVYDRVYANLKKVKQPISPGGKLTSFINSLFAKKAKKNVEIKGEVRDPMKRTVRIHRPPVADRDGLIIGKPPLLMPTNHSIEEEAAAIAKHVYDDDDDDDGFSDASSDLFELDHKTVFGKSRFCDELPVYEKTSYFVKKNRLSS